MISLRALAQSLVFLAVAATTLARAEPPGVTRVLKTFDFEERRLGNREELPMHWIKAEGPGLPRYVNGQLSTDRARSGKFSFRFDLDGGSLIYRYEPGQIRVQSLAHYRVEGFCQTTVLANARARITAYFTDLDGHPLAQTVRHSEPYAAKSDGEGWKPLSIELTADHPDAAYLIIELELLQPSLYAKSTLGQRTLWNQDIRGGCWFDDITVSQVPRVLLGTDRPGNIFEAGQKARLRVQVNDRFTDDLSAQLVITDARGQHVYQRSGALEMQSAEQLGPGRRAFSLDLPDLRPGWYEAALVMSSQGQFLATETLDLVLLADTGRRMPPDPRFGIIATSLPFAGWAELPQILPYLSAGRVKLAVWSDAGDIQQMDPASFDQLLERLQELGITPTACLLAPPPAIVKSMGGGWERILSANADTWRPQLAYLVSRHAAHLDRWQLGEDGSDVFVTEPQMRKVYDRVYQEFCVLTDHPDLAMPWPSWYDLSGQLPATVALAVPPSVLPSQIPLYIQDIKGQKGHNLSLSIELLDREKYGRDLQIRDLAQRVVYALAADARRIDLPLPFTVHAEAEQISKQPQELLMIVRTLTSMLGGTTYRGKVPLVDGVEAFLFDKGGQGIIALWDRGNTAGFKQVALNLGARAVSVDLWGNLTPLLRMNGDKQGDKVQLSIGQMPTFLVDIDGAQAQLRASVAVDRPLLESSFRPHVRRLRFINPYRQAIAGTLKIKAPAGWTLNPPTFNFSLNPEEQFDHEVTVEFPYNSFAGPKTLQCEFQLQSDGVNNFTVPLVLNLGLSDVGTQTLAIREGNDVVVQQLISNYGEKPIDYTAFAIFPGQARQERLVTQLAPGRTTMKRYRFPDVTVTQEMKLRVGLKEIEGTRILNDEVPIQ